MKIRSMEVSPPDAKGNVELLFRTDARNATFSAIRLPLAAEQVAELRQGLAAAVKATTPARRKVAAR